MKLFKDEKEIMSGTGGGKIVLTNFRIIRIEGSGSNEYRIDIFLENISSIEVHHSSKPLLLVIAIIAVITGGGLQSTVYMAIGIAIAVMLGIIWITTKIHSISVSSKGGAVLDVIISGMKKGEVTDFVDGILSAQLKRVMELNNHK